MLARMTTKKASPELEAFIDETIRVSNEHGYHPTTFQRMRRDYGTIGAIERLVQSGDIQSGFTRLYDLGLVRWSIESAVTKFPGEFSRNAIKCSEWRLQQVGESQGSE
jgi:hypothetical protein